MLMPRAAITNVIPALACPGEPAGVAGIRELAPAIADVWIPGTRPGMTSWRRNDELEHLGLGDPPAGAVAGAVHGADRARLRSFGQLPVTRFPNIDVPIVQVRVYQSGAAPSELEVQVTKKIEDAIAGVNGVKHQTSAVTEGSR